MTKLYEALMRASRERGKVRASPVKERETSRRPSIDVEEEMLTLFMSFESLLPQTTKKIIQFIGSREGETTSIIARRFAEFLASKISLSVLLMGPNTRHPAVHPSSSPMPGGTWLEAIGDPGGDDTMFHHFDDTRLFVSPPIDFSDIAPEVLESDSIRRSWALLRQRFDLMVIESAPTRESSDTLSVVADADCVVLVCESEEADLTADQSDEEIGLALVLEFVGQGALTPQQVVRCLGVPVLLLIPLEKVETS